MNRKDLDALNELYLSVYDEEQLNEKVGTALDAANELDRQGRGIAAAGLRAKAARVARGEDKPKVATDSGKGGQVTLNTPYASTLNNQPGVTRYQPIPGKPGRVARYFTPNQQQAEKKPLTGIAPVSRDTSGSSSSSSSSNVRPAPPKPSGPVLSKKNGVEGTGVGANFKARAFSAAEKSRYSSVAAKNAASSATPKPATEKSPQGYSVGTTAGGTKFERRTPTRQEMDAAKRAGGGEAGVKAAVASNQPTTGPTNATIDKSSVDASKAAFKPSTPGSGALRNAVATATAKPLDTNFKSINNKTKNSITPVNQANSYEWPSAKTIRDIAGAYSSIYEAKKKVDQDQDGDNDFADVRVARMIASGVPKAKAIAMVKDKSYNEEVEIDEATAMAKRGYDETEIRNKIAKSTGGGKFADKATELENRPTFGDKSKQASREKLARTQRGDFRRTTSSDYGLRLGAHKSDDPTVKAKQKARGAQRSALTPKEKKMLNREAYEAYEFVSSYLLENNFATTVDDANVIINNMSEGWFESIMEG